MRNRDEFKALIWEKKRAYYERKKKQRRRIVFTLLPAAVCFFLCILLYRDGIQSIQSNPSLQLHGSITEDTHVNFSTGTDSYGEQFPSFIVGNSNPHIAVAAWLRNPSGDEWNCEEPVQLYNCFELLREYANADASSGAIPGEDARVYTAVFTFRDGGSATYEYRKDGYIRVDGGRWMMIENGNSVEAESRIMDFFDE